MQLINRTLKSGWIVKLGNYKAGILANTFKVLSVITISPEETVSFTDPDIEIKYKTVTT